MENNIIRVDTPKKVCYTIDIRLKEAMYMANQKRMDLTTGKPIRQILLFSLPLVVGSLFQQMYSFVDTIMVGRLISGDALAAVGEKPAILGFDEHDFGSRTRISLGSVKRPNEAAAKLLEYDDFTSFAKLNSNNKTNICHISYARWCVEQDGTLRFTIRADRFLRNMVRAIVGTLVDVGRGRYSVAEFEDIIRSRDLSRCSAGAPACGLFLSDVRYE